MAGHTLYLGKVTRIDTHGVYVEAPRLGVGSEYGPCESCVAALVVGDRVVVGSIEGIHEDLVVIGRVGG